MGNCKVKCSLCCVQQEWWGLHWELRQGCCAGGLWGVPFLPLSEVFQMRRHCSATTVLRALPVCEWPALGMPWGTTRSNAASAVCSSCEASGTGGCGRAEQVVCGGGCRFAAEWRFRRGGGSTRQPQRTEPCQCVGGQPWAYHGSLQGQMLSLHCAAGVVESALGAAAGPGRRSVVGAVVLNTIETMPINYRHCRVTLQTFDK